MPDEVAERNNTLKSFPRELYTKLKEKLIGGEMEYFYKTEAPVFNISVYQDIGRIAQHQEGEKQGACQTFSEELTKLSDKPVTLFECRFEQMDKLATLYLIADAYRDGQNMCNSWFRRPRTKCSYSPGQRSGIKILT